MPAGGIDTQAHATELLSRQELGPHALVSNLSLSRQQTTCCLPHCQHLKHVQMKLQRQGLRHSTDAGS